MLWKERGNLSIGRNKTPTSDQRNPTTRDDWGGGNGDAAATKARVGRTCKHWGDERQQQRERENRGGEESAEVRPPPKIFSSKSGRLVGGPKEERGLLCEGKKKEDIAACAGGRGDKGG